MPGPDMTGFFRDNPFYAALLTVLTGSCNSSLPI